jgi:uncharacterized protein YfaS (alpha-2-macroglobulin family)
MASPAQNIGTAIQTVSAQIAAVLANPLPSYTVDGVTKNTEQYYKMLTDQLKSLIELQQKCDGPFTVTSVNR